MGSFYPGPGESRVMSFPCLDSHSQDIGHGAAPHLCAEEELFPFQRCLPRLRPSPSQRRSASPHPKTTCRSSVVKVRCSEPREAMAFAAREVHSQLGVGCPRPLQVALKLVPLLLQVRQRPLRGQIARFRCRSPPSRNLRWSNTRGSAWCSTLAKG